MANIANLVIIENGQREVYYNHWIALEMDAYLFWGAEKAVSYFRSHKKMDKEPWSQDGNGAALIDLDKKVLLFYGGEALYYNSLLYPFYIALLQQTWKGYQVRCAYNGLVDIINYVGLPAKEFSQLLSYPFLPEDAIAEFFENYADYDNYFYTGLISIQTKDALNLIPLPMQFMDNTEYLFVGENFINYASKLASTPVATIEKLFERDGFPELGMHFDFPKKILYFWQNSIGYIGDIDYEALQQCWPQWKIHPLNKEYLQHLQLIHQPQLFPSLSQEKALAEIEPLVCRDYSVDTFIDEDDDFSEDEADNTEISAELKVVVPFIIDKVERQKIFTMAKTSLSIIGNH